MKPKSLIALFLLILSPAAFAALPPDTRALKVNDQGKLVPAPPAQLNQPSIYRQILILPTGYTPADRPLFDRDIAKMLTDMGNLPAPLFTRTHRDKLIYLVQWRPGQSLASGKANFGGRIFEHPMRGGAGISVSNDRVVFAVDYLIRQAAPQVNPIAVIILFNSNLDGTADAIPAPFLNRPYGMARVTRGNINNAYPWHGRPFGQYVPVHELAHAALGFNDEYTELALADLDIHRIDIATPLLCADNTLTGLRLAFRSLVGDYDLRLSQVLADNGFENTATRQFVSTVVTPGYDRMHFNLEGGMGFGLGTFHATGDNIMNSDRGRNGMKPEGDRFAWSHSPAQLKVIAEAFDPANRATRPNDRLRIAGPMLWAWPRFGPNINVLMFDADKHHRWHPTQQYEIQITWQFLGFRFSRTQFVTPTRKDIDVRNTIFARVAGLARDLAVRMGIKEIPASQGQKINIAKMTLNEMLEDMLPTTSAPLPYQEATVRAPYPFRQYTWRFRTFNGTTWSGWSAWGRFYRAL